MAVKKITVEGVKLDIDKDVLGSYELLECISRLDTNAAMVPKMIDMLVGVDGAETIKLHIKDKHEKLTVELMMDFLGKILKAANPN